jgi:ferric-dicitrate binding protein FerR (iron transport regulator)
MTTTDYHDPTCGKCVSGIDPFHKHPAPEPASVPVSEGSESARIAPLTAESRSWWAATLAIGACAVGSVWLLVWGVGWCLTHAH